ncbi:MAG: plastocyanin [Planctomycetota bacterium]|jgi:plastocyanin
MSISHASALTKCALSVALFSTAASAQQFQYQVGLIPGTARWAEGVESADVDNDGDLDLFFAEGEGFTGPGTQRQNTLVINQFVGSGTLSFTNESVARLGVHLSNAKGVATGDIDGDGYVDAIFANAFNTDRPFLYINKGAGQPGFYDEEGIARGLSEVLSSAGAGFGDLDSDGDLDLILNDVGSSFLGGAGDRPNLYINDGSGNFTEKTGAGWNPPVKKAQMDVQFVDVDNDFDLDFVGYCRGSNASGNHYLMLNDGNANFTNSSATIPNGSSSSYEAEFGDLDGDNDIDMFMVSMSGFREGAVKNNWIESGETTLSYTTQTPLNVQQDDNEIALCDYDNDGDLDAFVGSLATKERIWKNDGNIGFTADHGEMQTVGDSTLDCTFADLNNDGRYDFITAQGESNSGNWVNKVYVNNGPVDTRAPEIRAVQQVGDLTSDFGPWVALGKAQDAVMDDGVNYVSATAHFVVANSVPANVTINAGSFSPSNINISAGGSVVFANASGSDQTVTSSTAPWAYDSGTLANGQLFEVAYVRPGVYTYTSLLGLFVGTVTVSGSADSVDSTYSGGGVYRFGMTGDASAAGAALVYELEFTDWADNVSVTNVMASGHPASVGIPYCFGDGGGTPCPCGNTGSAGSGCNNSVSAGGATISASGNPTVASDTLVLSASGCPTGNSGLFFQGATQVGGALGVSFGDGLLCAGGSIVRLQVAPTDGSGTATSSIVISVKGGVSAGQTQNYQYWYRDPAAGPCGNGFNTSNALEITWN